LAAASPRRRCALTAPFHPYRPEALQQAPGLGGVISVALSRGFPRVGVIDHPALRCPDFPRRRKPPRLLSLRRPAYPSRTALSSASSRSRGSGRRSTPRARRSAVPSSRRTAGTARRRGSPAAPSLRPRAGQASRRDPAQPQPGPSPHLAQPQPGPSPHPAQPQPDRSEPPARRRTASAVERRHGRCSDDAAHRTVGERAVWS
jgi:hypothetical protein